METLDNKRARLRRELRRAYGDWMETGEGHGAPPTTKWSDYLAAKRRLIAAYAEQVSAP